jgi:ribosomal protein L35
MHWSKGPKKRLRFTKTGDPKLEEAYARHFVWPGKKGPFHPTAPGRNSRPHSEVNSR